MAFTFLVWGRNTCTHSFTGLAKTHGGPTRYSVLGSAKSESQAHASTQASTFLLHGIPRGLVKKLLWTTQLPGPSAFQQVSSCGSQEMSPENHLMWTPAVVSSRNPSLWAEKDGEGKNLRPEAETVFYKVPAFKERHSPSFWTLS